MTQRTRTPRSDLIPAYFSHPTALRDAMEGDGRYPVKLGTGHTVVFVAEGDELVARLTREQAAALSGIPGYEIEGFEPARPYVHPTPSWMEEGERLAQEKIGGKQNKGSSVIAELAALIGPDKLASLMSELVGGKVDAAAQQLAEQRMAKEAAEKAAQSGEFHFVRLAENLSDDHVIDLLNRFDPGTDPIKLSSAAGVSRLSKIAPENEALQHAIRELLG